MPIELRIEEQLRAGATIVGFSLRLVAPVRRQTLSLQLTGSGQRLGTADDRAVDFTSRQRTAQLIDQSLRLIAPGARIDRQAFGSANRLRIDNGGLLLRPKGAITTDKIGYRMSKHPDAG